MFETMKSTIEKVSAVVSKNTEASKIACESIVLSNGQIPSAILLRFPTPKKPVDKKQKI